MKVILFKLADIFECVLICVMDIIIIIVIIGISIICTYISIIII